MTKTNSERLAVMEEQLKQNKTEHYFMKEVLSRLENKLDVAMEAKLDKIVFNDYKGNSQTWARWVPQTVIAIVALIIAFIK